MSTPSKRKQRKDMARFCKDHCWGWRPPMKLRRMRAYTKEEVDYLYHLRSIDAEAGRKRMVARGLTQYAKPGDILPSGQLIEPGMTRDWVTHEWTKPSTPPIAP